eukprot:363553-Chlamydomonas_euryale.AAC.7
MEGFLESVAAEVKARAGQLELERSERQAIEAANATLQVWGVDRTMCVCGQLEAEDVEVIASGKASVTVTATLAVWPAGVRRVAGACARACALLSAICA